MTAQTAKRSFWDEPLTEPELIWLLEKCALNGDVEAISYLLARLHSRDTKQTDSPTNQE
jgi:hypothetical protein